MKHNIDFLSMAEKWPSSYVARTQLGTFTGGIINQKTMANLDSQGKGIPNRIRIGRKIAYKIEDVCKFLQERAEACESQKAVTNG